MRFLSDFASPRVFDDELKMTEIQTLLAPYVNNGLEETFHELVANYLGLAYSTAVRLVDAGCSGR
jgi:hypothetical protein